MRSLDKLYKLFEKCEVRAKQNFKPKVKNTKDTRTARASAINTALNNIENQLRGIQ